MHQFRLNVLEPLVVGAKIERSGCAGTLLARRVIEGVLVAGRQRCRRYRARGVSVGGSDRAWRAGPSLSCGIQVHSSSPLPCRQNLCWRRARNRLRATPESGARNACAAAAKAAASPARDSRLAEIPPCLAANSSARDSPRAAAPLRLRASRHTSIAEICAANSKRAPVAHPF